MPAMPWKIKLCIGKNNYFPDWYLAMGELAAREFDSQSQRQLNGGGSGRRARPSLKNGSSRKSTQEKSSGQGKIAGIGGFRSARRIFGSE